MTWALLSLGFAFGATFNFIAARACDPRTGDVRMPAAFSALCLAASLACAVAAGVHP